MCSHPVLAFHQEVLSILKWINIRNQFYQALIDTDNGITWTEEGKLWRHSREALGKWILSQVARTRYSTSHMGFFSFILELEPRQDSQKGHGESQPKAFSAVYNEQLTRDLSLKSDGVHNTEVIESIKQLLKKFDLYGRCLTAYLSVQKMMLGVEASASDLYAPVLQKVTEDSPNRTNAQKRIQGLFVQMSVSNPRASLLTKRHLASLSTPIPWVVWEKLACSYEAFGFALDRHHSETLSQEKCFLYRAATVALRYEVGLATGSLQLCADVTLKQHLHARGYHVIDLCASPINAYMEEPRLGSFSMKPALSSCATTSTTSSGKVSTKKSKIIPNRFCSAFYDTDCYFGSIGSALHVNPFSLYQLCADVIPPQKQLILTLDVPYDEDICELLFQKLSKDMRSVSEASESTLPVDYLMVIPLWWRVPMPTNKIIFTSDNPQLSNGTTTESRSRQELLEKVLQDHTAVLEQGYRVAHHWPEVLAAASASQSLGSDQHSEAIWAVFDAVFIGESYTYFCASTNRALSGVTTTEVIGLRQPPSSSKARDPDLKEVLYEFYQI